LSERKKKNPRHVFGALAQEWVVPKYPEEGVDSTFAVQKTKNFGNEAVLDMESKTDVENAPQIARSKRAIQKMDKSEPTSDNVPVLCANRTANAAHLHPDDHSPIRNR
jgi:hypothetical protein